MQWFRSNIRYGSRLALFALALQFVFSFGHFHGIAAQATTAIQLTSHQAPSDPEQPATDSCVICAVMALANALLFSSPPILLLPQAVELLYLTTDAEFIHLDSARVVFQPRAPPAS